MIIFLEDNSTKVNMIHYQPELLTEERKAEGYIIDSKPEPIKTAGKRPELHYDAATGELWYEYIDKPLTEKERIEELEAIVADMLLADMGSV